MELSKLALSFMAAIMMVSPLTVFAATQQQEVLPDDDTVTVQPQSGKAGQAPTQAQAQAAAQQMIAQMMDTRAKMIVEQLNLGAIRDQVNNSHTVYQNGQTMVAFSVDGNRAATVLGLASGLTGVVKLLRHKGLGGLNGKVFLGSVALYFLTTWSANHYSQQVVISKNHQDVLIDQLKQAIEQLAEEQTSYDLMLSQITAQGQ